MKEGDRNRGEGAKTELKYLKKKDIRKRARLHGRHLLFSDTLLPDGLL